MIEILKLEKEYVAVNKPRGMASQSDTTGDTDAMSETSRILGKRGEDDSLWLVHRLDRVVGGVLVFARSKSSAAALSELVSSRGMEKEYIAVVEGEATGGELYDHLYKDAVQGKAFVVSGARRGAKEARLEYSPISVKVTEKGVRTLVRIKLITGRFHQIRAQFSSRGMPLVGDGKYGSHDNRAKMPALFSARVAFTLRGKKCEITALPDVSDYPWSLFDLENYK